MIDLAKEKRAGAGRRNEKRTAGTREARAQVRTKAALDITRRVLVILLGELIAALAVNIFIVPHHLLSGGVWGIALLLNYKLGWSMALLVLILNVPLFIFGLFKVGRRFIVLTGVSIAASSFFLWATELLLQQININLTVQNTIISAIFGGALVGLGCGMVMRQGSSTGGTDIVAIILSQRYSFPIGTLSTVINVVILAIMAIFFGLEIALITLVSIFVNNRVLDVVQEGFNRKKAILIISDHMDHIVPRVLQELHRGATILKAEGAYTHADKQVLYVIVNIMQLSKTKEIILACDPQAFFTVMDAKEVVGKGFYDHKSFKDDKPVKPQ